MSDGSEGWKYAEKLSHSKEEGAGGSVWRKSRKKLKDACTVMKGKKRRGRERESDKGRWKKMTTDRGRSAVVCVADVNGM